MMSLGCSFLMLSRFCSVSAGLEITDARSGANFGFDHVPVTSTGMLSPALSDAPPCPSREATSFGCRR